MRGRGLPDRLRTVEEGLIVKRPYQSTPEERRERLAKTLREMQPSLTDAQIDILWAEVEKAGEELHRATTRGSEVSDG